MLGAQKNLRIAQVHRDTSGYLRSYVWHGMQRNVYPESECFLSNDITDAVGHGHVYRVFQKCKKYFLIIMVTAPKKAPVK